MFDFDEIIIFNAVVVSLGIVYGIVAQKGKFCFSGGLKDTILLKDTSRSSSILVAMIVSVVTTNIVAHLHSIELSSTRYFLNINYLEIIIGGLIFGYGMMKSDGCGSRHLVKFAQGDKNSLYVLLVVAISSYFTYSNIAFINTVFFQNYIMSFFHTDKAVELSIYFILGALVLILLKSLASAKSLIKNIDGVVIGILIACGWYVSAVFSEDMFLLIPSQSLSFIYPVGKIFEYTVSFFNPSYLLFSVFIVFGVLIGAFISSKLSSKKVPVKTKTKNNAKSVTMIGKLFGGVCLGFGGVLVLGCTVGQGLGGLSTLSLASALAISSIYVSAYFTGLAMHKNNMLSTSFSPSK